MANCGWGFIQAERADDLAFLCRFFDGWWVCWFGTRQVGGWGYFPFVEAHSKIGETLVRTSAMMATGTLSSFLPPRGEGRSALIRRPWWLLRANQADALWHMSASGQR